MVKPVDSKDGQTLSWAQGMSRKLDPSQKQVGTAGIDCKKPACTLGDQDRCAVSMPIFNSHVKPVLVLVGDMFLTIASPFSFPGIRLKRSSNAKNVCPNKSN